MDLVRLDQLPIPLDKDTDSFVMYDTVNKEYILGYALEGELYLDEDTILSGLGERYFPVLHEHNAKYLWFRRMMYHEYYRASVDVKAEQKMTVLHENSHPAGFEAMCRYIDFEDLYIFLSRYSFIDYIYCPKDHTGQPLYYCTGKGVLYAENTENIFKAHGPNLKVICNYNTIEIYGGYNEVSILRKDLIKDMLVSEKDVIDMVDYNLLIKVNKNANLDISHVHGAGLVDMTVYKKFYINESTRTVTAMKNMILEYNTYGTHVKILRKDLNPKLHKHVDYNLWEVSVVLPSHDYDLFINDLNYLIGTIENNEAVDIIASKINIKEVTVGISDINATHTKKYTINELSKIRSPSGKSKPVIFPPHMLAEAKIYAKSVHGTRKAIYTGYKDGTLLGGYEHNKDDILAYYVAPSTYRPYIVNKAIDHVSLVPYCSPSDNIQLTEDRPKYTEFSLEGPGLDNATVKYNENGGYTLRECLNMEDEADDPLMPELGYRLCKDSTCFDMSMEEFIESFKDFDTRLHLPYLEHIHRFNIIIYNIKHIEADNCIADLEIPRHQGPYRRSFKYNKTRLLLKQSGQVDKYFAIKTPGGLKVDINKYNALFTYVDVEGNPYRPTNEISHLTEYQYTMEDKLSIISQVFTYLSLFLYQREGLGVSEIKKLVTRNDDIDEIFESMPSNWNIYYLYTKKGLSASDLVGFYFPVGIPSTPEMWVRLAAYIEDHVWPKVKYLYNLHYQNPRITLSTIKHSRSFQRYEYSYNRLSAKHNKYSYEYIPELPPTSRIGDIGPRTEFILRLSSNVVVYGAKLKEDTKIPKGWKTYNKEYRGLKSLINRGYSENVMFIWNASEALSIDNKYLIRVYVK